MLRSIVVRGGKADPKKQILSFSQEEEKWYSRERDSRIPNFVIDGKEYAVRHRKRRRRESHSHNHHDVEEA